MSAVLLRRWWWKRRWVEEEVVEVDNLLLRVCVCVSGRTGSSTARHAAEHAALLLR